MSTFWERRLAETKQAQREAVAQADVPWWAQGTSLIRTAPILAQAVSEPQTVLQQRMQPVVQDNSCPECGSGNYMQPPDSSRASRCFDCGYVKGREIRDSNRPGSGIVPGSVHQAKQTVAGGSSGSNYHGNITTASEAVNR